MPGMTFEDGLKLWELIRSFLTILAWPGVVLVIVLIFRPTLADLLAKVERAELPWGAGTVEFGKEAAKLSAEANKPDPEKVDRPPPPTQDATTNYNTLQIERGLRPTASNLELNYFRELVLRDPNLALAALRMEIEILISNLALGFDETIREQDGPGRNLRMIHQKGLITTQQFDIARGVLDLCNRALHGARIDAPTALAVIEAASSLLKDYKAWLFWNFADAENSAPSRVIVDPPAN